MSFQSLGLCDALLKNVRLSGYTDPTPIQRATIPHVLAGRDVLGCAQTGTGKTAAFALPILQRLKEIPSARPGVRMIRALILSPTRELAQQTYDNFLLYGKGFGMTPCVLFGGVSQVGQAEALHEGADIVVACPGRLLDLMGQGLIRLEGLDIFVLDEADRMLDMGFIHDVRRVIKALPEKRQSLFFSATMPPDVEKLAMEILKNPETVKVDPVTSTVDAIDQCLYYVDKPNKRHLLAYLLKSEELENALVFSRTKHGVDRIVRELKRAGIDAEGIHGDKSQGARQNALNRFKGGKCKVLVATDIAARGIDIEGLSHVINYDLPNEPESYIHRIGRTGRAGRSGKAISFCCIDETKQLNQIEKLIGKRLREEKSDWPMENFTPSPPKVSTPRPSKVRMNGEAAPAAPRRPVPAGTAAANPAPAPVIRKAKKPEIPSIRSMRKEEDSGRGPRKQGTPVNRVAGKREVPEARGPRKPTESPVRGREKTEMPPTRNAQNATAPSPASGGTELKPAGRVPDSGELFSPSGGTPLHDTSSLFSQDGWEAFQAARRR